MAGSRTGRRKREVGVQSASRSTAGAVRRRQGRGGEGARARAKGGLVVAGVGNVRPLCGDVRRRASGGAVMSVGEESGGA